MVDITIDVDDLTKDIKKLASINEKKLLSIYKSSISKASIQTIVKEARRDLKSLLSDTTGETAKSLGIKQGRRKNITMIGARTGGKHHGQLIHILEQGTKNRQTKKGANRGMVYGLLFYQQAFNSKKTDLVQKFDNNMRQLYMKHIIKEIKK